MMKKPFYYLLAALLLPCLFSCTDALDEGYSPAPAEGYTRMDITALLPEMPVVNTRSSAGGVEMEQQVYAFCFDGEGGLLEVKKATTATVSEDACSFTVEVPNASRIIHYIAGSNLSAYEGDARRGENEQTLIPTLTSGCVMKNVADVDVYFAKPALWGRATYKDADDLRAEKLPQMTRNFAKVSCTLGEALTEQSVAMETFTVLDTRAKGTIAPFNVSGQTADEKFGYDASEEGKRFVTEVPGEEDEKNVPNPSAGVQHTTEYCIYENVNRVDNPVSFVVKLLKNNEPPKFYRIGLLDEDATPYPVWRNCHYRINITKMPPAEFSYNSFAAAAADDAVMVNNPWITIEPDLPVCGDGKSTLLITDGVHQGFTKEGEVKLGFTYTPEAGVTATPTVTLLGNEEVVEGTPEVVTEDKASGKYAVKLTLNTPPKPADGKRYATAKLLVKAGKLGRIVTLYLMEPFKFQNVTFDGQSQPGPNEGNKWCNVIDANKELVKGQKYTFKYSIPDGYPEKLLPVKVRITSNHGVPYRIKVDDWPYTDLPVVYEDTNFKIVRNGTTVDVNPPYGFKYAYTMDNYRNHNDRTGGYNMDYTVEWQNTHASGETGVPQCCFTGTDKMHVHLFLQGNLFEDYEAIVTFTNQGK